MLTKSVLKGATVMIAASSKGLGYGIAEVAAQQGANLSLTARTSETLEKAAQQLRDQYNVDVITHAGDVTDLNTINTWTEKTLECFNRIDGLVVNAGGPPAGMFEDFDDEAWQTAFDTTLMSSVRMIRAVLPTMKKQKQGSIVTVTSSSIKEPIPILLLSNVLRSGVTSLVKSLSTEYASQNIRFNNLAPGRFDTDRVASLDKFNAEKKGIDIEAQREEIGKTIPMGRYGESREFGEAGAFLLSNAASYVTGQTILVDGGASKTVW